MSYDNTNKGAIWGNTRKEKDTHPDLTGSINIEGKEYWVSAWKRKPDENPKAPALRLSVKLKEQPQQAAPQQQASYQQPQQAAAAPQQNSGGYDDFDDDIPF